MIKKAQAWSQTAVIAITRGTSENFDNLAFPGEVYLTKEEELLIKNVSSLFKQTILLINSGYPMDVRCAEKYEIKVVLWTGSADLTEAAVITSIQCMRKGCMSDIDILIHFQSRQSGIVDYRERKRACVF